MFVFDLFTTYIEIENCYFSNIISKSTMLELFNSSIQIKNSKFADNINPTIMLLNSNFSFINSSLNNSLCKVTQLGCAFFLLNSKLLIINSIFLNLISYLTDSGSIYSEKSVINITKSKFEKTISLRYGSCIFSFYSKIYLNETNFSYSQPSCLYLCISYLEGYFINIFNNSFLLYSPLISKESVFLLSNSKLFNNYGAENGGAISIYHNFLDNFEIVNDFNIIINSSFVNNTAIMKGGSIFISNQNLKIFESEFLNSHAQKGGALSFENFDFFEANFIIENSNFLNNKAYLEGGAFNYLNSPVFERNCNYLLNNAYYGKTFSAYPVRMSFKIFQKNVINGILIR